MDKKTMIFAIAGMLALPMAAAATTLENQDVVTGHTMFADMSGFDEDIAAIAGHAESRVVWFNGQSIMNTVSEGFIYAVESEASCTPLEGSNFTFQDYGLSYIDPNNESHIVAHYTYSCGPGGIGLGPVDELLFDDDIYHVWVTHTHELAQDNPIVAEGDAGRTYNFALAVDTSLMNQDEEQLTHSGEGGRTTSELNGGDGYCPEEDAHHCGNGAGNEEHEHNTAQVDLFYSKEDKGFESETEDGGIHPGTLEGCDNDTHCSDVRDGSWEDPDSSA